MPNFKDHLKKVIKPNRPLPDALPPGHIPNPLRDYYDKDAPPLEQTGIPVRRTFDSLEAADQYLAREGSVDAARADIEARAAVEKQRAAELERQAERDAHRLTIQQGGRGRFGR